MTDSHTQRLESALADRYRIQRKLGEGGMASVYLAEDLKHERRVAIKVLRPELAAVIGGERFLAEIKTTANLQHPHILPLFDSGEAEGFLFYVMPYIAGETLRDRLDREKQLGVEEAVRIATEVADALDYAHRHGVVHRDIKPANILLGDGRALVADFGIALAVSAAGGGRMTETGLSLGTPHYMSPEQATADKDVTSRSDLYSLAGVLYEMLTGQPPHTAGSVQAIIMKIVTERPEPARKARHSVPRNVDAALSKALEKLPADRFDTARAFAEALGNPSFIHGAEAATLAASRAPWYRHAPTVSLSVLVLMLAAALVAVTARGRSDTGGSKGVIRMALTADPGVHVDTRTTRPFAVSADGTTVVFRASTDSTQAQLWVRRLDDVAAHPLAGTEGGWNPAISPDGVWVAFITDGFRILKVRLDGGDVSTVVGVSTRSAALSWLSDQEILFESLGADGHGIQRVPVVGGTPAVAVPLDSVAGEIQQRRPFAFRDVGVVVYGSTVRDQSQTTLVAYRLSDGRRERLDLPGIGVSAFVDGHLVYSLQDGTLMGVPFDPSAMRTTGAPVELSPRVASNGSIGTAVGISEGGTLVHRAVGASTEAWLELVDTTGRSVSMKGSFSIVNSPRFSPDGRRIAVLNGGSTGGSGRVASGDLWVVDTGTGVSTRIIADGSAGSFSWFPDGRRIAFTDRSAQELRSVDVGGSASASRLAATGAYADFLDAVPEGKSVVIAGYFAGGRVTLVRSWIDGSSRVDTLLARTDQGGGVAANYPRVSPDGRWVAVVDDWSSEVWVKSLEGPTLLQVSTSGTNQTPVVWGPDSRHLYYVGTQGLVVIELQTSPSLAVVRRQTLPGVLSGARFYDLSPDGKTFVVARTPSRADDVLVTVGWLDEARKAWAEQP